MRFYACHSIDIRNSSREKLPNGFMRVTGNKLTKHQVSPYLGKEIGGGDALGLAEDKVYGLYRAGDELKKAAPSYGGIPLLMGHHDFDPKNPPVNEVIGAVGTDTAFDGEFIVGSLTLWREDAIKAVEDGSCVELSCGYSYDLDPTAGEYGGECYDGIMRNIRPEHMALVERGRAGSEVRVADSALAEPLADKNKVLDGDLPGHAGHGNQFVGGVGGARAHGATTTSAPRKKGKGKPMKKGRLTAPNLNPPVGDIAPRKDVSKKSGVTKYGKVSFADPVNNKYPLDTVKHVRNALSRWGDPNNRAKYSKSDQAEIGSRIRAAAKRLGIHTTTGDSAGNHKENIMAKNTMSPLAHRVEGGTYAFLRSKLAKDSAIDGKALRALVDQVSAKRFASQINGVVGGVKAKFGLNDADADGLRSILLDMAPDPDEAEENKEGKDEEKDTVGRDDEADGDGTEDEDEEGMDGDKPAMAPAEVEKKIGDAVSAAVKKATDAARALRTAEKDVFVVVGEVNGEDTAEGVYKFALTQMGVALDGVEPSAYRALFNAVKGVKPEGHKADDAAAADNVATFERFPELKTAGRRIG